MTMVVIGYDRYNVIVKGMQGAKITAGTAVIILAAIWAYSTLGSLPPFIFGWGDYSLGEKPKPLCCTSLALLHLQNIFPKKLPFLKFVQCPRTKDDGKISKALLLLEA